MTDFLATYGTFALQSLLAVVVLTVILMLILEKGAELRRFQRDLTDVHIRRIMRAWNKYEGRGRW